ncbi:hypothetical protein PDE_00764 [Penicillium oxalicum 114-2]|uniref:Uncharacterized protein n=1 Tax=Penicillium oxalicum (strain 114-2 / CGMCC 5302) TaxID=933388 RepID=S8AJB2_PENO1|nr:hypothetical protein PDE_00764 [Penicillium oxalicum 114-2]
MYDYWVRDSRYNSYPSTDESFPKELSGSSYAPRSRVKAAMDKEHKRPPCHPERDRIQETDRPDVKLGPEERIKEHR